MDAVPNLPSCFRLLLVPALLATAWSGLPELFVVGLRPLVAHRCRGFRAGLTVAIPSPIALSPAMMSNGVFRFFFTNTPGANSTMLSTTNVSLPLNNRTALGSLVEISPGQFRFTHSKATTNEQHFYCVRAP